MEFSFEQNDELYLPETCKCPKCGRVLKNERVLSDHLRYCKKNLYHQCEHCPFLTKYVTNLNVHVSSMHSMTNFTEEECPNCAKKYKNQRSLKMHLRICEQPCLFRCYDCSKNFKSKSNLNRHISRKHLKVSVDGKIIGENMYLQCNECSYKTKHKEDLKKHVIKHFGDTKAVCQKCGRTYKNQGYLKKHSKYCQTKNLGCYRCSFKTHSKLILKNHVYNLHIKGPRYECPDCGKTYKNEINIVKHLQQNCGKEPQLMCEYCPFRTKYGHSLKKHRTNMHLENNKSQEKSYSPRDDISREKQPIFRVAEQK